MAFSSNKKQKLFTEINITPLTDIFLVLLIIMMVIAPLLDQQGLNLTVPENVKAENVKEAKTINFVITNDDKFMLDGQEVEADQLESVISSQSKTLTDGLLIQSDPEATHGAIVKLMDSARNSGVTNISVVGL